MKKLLLSSILLCIGLFTIQAQDDITQAREDVKAVKEVVFYGADFSKVKIFGAKESPLQLKYGLFQINEVFTSETNKYNVYKYFGKVVSTFDMKQTSKHNEDRDEDQLLTFDTSNELTEKDIQDVIGKLTTDKKDVKTGLIFIGEFLDKPNHTGTFQVVFFDIPTKKVIYSKRASGKAGGYGIRNYWANSIYRVMKDWKY